MQPGDLVAVAIAFVGGSGFSKILEIVVDRARGATERRRAEVDSLARQLIEAQAEEAEAARERRIALELLSATRRLALDHGIPIDLLPPVDL